MEKHVENNSFLEPATNRIQNNTFLQQDAVQKRPWANPKEALGQQVDHKLKH